LAFLITLSSSLAIEYFAIGRAIVATGEANTESEEKVAEANARAEEAKLETERLKAQFAWRQISREQEQILRHTLEEQGSSVLSWVFMEDVETNNFALDLRAIFRLSGWRVSLSFAGYTGNHTA
jgi:hypothetical protein